MQTPIKKISLTFRDENLEREFRDAGINGFIGRLKMTILFGIFTYISFLIYDFIFDNELFNHLVTNRVLVVAVLLLFFGLSFTEFIKKNYFLTYTTLFTLIYGSLIHTITFDITQASFLTLIIIFFTLIPFVTFRNVLVVYVLASITFFYTLTHFVVVDDLQFSRYSAIFICGSVISGLIFYEKQKTERLSFLKTKWSKEKNAILKKDAVKLQNQAALAQILQNSTGTDINLNEFLQQSLEIILDLPWLDIVSKGSISLTNDNNDDIIMVASKDLGILTETCAVLKPGDCLCGKAVQQKKFLFNKCVTEDHNIRPDGMAPHGHFNLPLLLDDKVLGVLNLYVDHNHTKTDEEVDFLTLIADTLTSVIYRDHLKNEKNRQQLIIKQAFTNIEESINYAQRIQSSILTVNTKCLQIFDDLGIFFMPKETVSGDFYFARKKGDKTYVAVGDCTGHGVPGALVSTLGVLQLEHIVKRHEVEVSEMLDILNEKINQLLNNDSQIGSDGMDITLLCIDRSNKTITYSGAKGIFYMYQNNELIQHKTDRVSIGENSDGNFKFTQETISFDTGDNVYLLSDGFIDQISLDTGKRIGSKKVKELFTKISPMELEENQDEISEFFDLHMPEEHTDDITLISFKL